MDNTLSLNKCIVVLSRGAHFVHEVVHLKIVNIDIVSVLFMLLFFLDGSESFE